MKKVLYTIELTLPDKTTITLKDLNNEKIMKAINEAIKKYYGFELLKLRKHHLDSLKSPNKRHVKKIVNSLLKLIDYKIIKGEELKKHKIQYSKTKAKNNNIETK